MSFDSPGGVNPFEAPLAEIGERALSRNFDDNDAELIRRQHFGREANIKSLGQLSYLGAFILGLLSIGTFLTAAGVLPAGPQFQNGLDPAQQKILFAVVGVVYLAFTALNIAIGYGLTHLHIWARWTLVVLTVIGLLYVAGVSVVAMMLEPTVGLVVLVVGGGINGFILYLLVSGKAGVVFSGEYKEIIRKTPQVKHKTSLILQIFVALLLFVVFIGLVAYFLRPRP